MRIFHHRPLALAVCAAVLAAILSLRLDGQGRLLLLAAALAVGLLCTVLSLFRRRLTLPLLSGILIAALSAALLTSSYLWFGPISERYLSRTDETVTAEGYVTERLASYGEHSRFAVRLTEFDGERTRGSVLLECDYRSALQAGDVFRVRGYIRAFEVTEDYDEATVLRADGLAAVLVSPEPLACTVTGETVQTPLLALRQSRLTLSERLRSAIGGEEGALACALLLGDRAELSNAVTLAFRRSGVSHLLALSGLHVSILIGILEWLLRRLRVPRLVRVAAVPPIAVGYLLLTGAAVSTVRAVLMVTVVSLAYLSAERYDPFTALSVALFCILAVLPYSVLDLSLWLSFGAAASIIIFLPSIRPILESRRWGLLPRPLSRCLRGLVGGVATGLFASSGILAVSVLWIGSTSVFSVPITLLLSPVVTAALFLGLVTLVLPFAPMAFLARLPLRAMLSLTEAASAVPNALILPTEPAERVLLISSLVLILAAAILPLKRKRWIALPIAASVAFMVVGYLGTARPNELTVLCTHTGVGEMLTVMQDRRSVIFDLTDGSSQAASAAVDALAEVGCAEVDELILTHYHSRTTSLLGRLSARVKLRGLRLPYPETEDECAIAARLAEEAVRLGVEMRYGLEEIALSQVCVERLLLARGSGMEVSVELRLRIGAETLTALSSELVGGEAWLEILDRLQGSDTLLLSSHGKRDTAMQVIRLPSGVSRVIWGDEQVAALHPTVAPPDAWWVGERTVRYAVRPAS